MESTSLAPVSGHSVRESSIVQVVAEVSESQVLRPFANAGSKLVAGSGVILDAKQGLVVSNAHVTGNAINLTVFSAVTGKRALHCELVSIMREKDLALIRIVPEDRAILLEGRQPEDLNARLIDHLTLRQGCHLYAAGFPLGTRHIQVTTGCLSGLSTSDSFVKLTQYEDSTQRDPTFVVTSAALNHGMSGGGLFDESGGLVGIITAGIPGASQIGFAIPSRVILANYAAMLNHISPIPPTLHFRWSNVSESTVAHLSKRRIDSVVTRPPTSSRGGMMVRHVLPDSVFFDVLERGDLMQSLEFDLPAVHCDSLVVPTPEGGRKKSKSKSTRVEGKIETHGDLTLSRVDGTLDERLSARKFSIPEIVDYLIAGSRIKIRFSRRGESIERDVGFDPHEDIFRIRGTYHILDPHQWIKVGGVVMQNTTLNILAECSRYKYIAEIPYYDDLIFTPSVVVTYVEPSSEVGSLSAFAEGDLIVFVDGNEVSSVEDIREILDTLDIDKKSVAIETDRGAIALCDLDDKFD